jgi:hypothetical protein
VHNDGLGQNFYDCVALNTHNSGEAMAACIAYALSIGKTAADCSDGWGCPMYPSTTFVCQGAGGTSCDTDCWGYGSTASGWVTSCTVGCNVKQGTWN